MTAFGLHGAEQGMDGRAYSIDIDVHDFGKHLGGDVFEMVGRRIDPGTENQDVRGAEVGNGGIHSVINLGMVAHIEAQGMDSLPVRLPGAFGGPLRCFEPLHRSGQQQDVRV